MKQLSDIPNVHIDNEGGYKFIVIKVSDGKTNKLIIRADKNKSYHADIFRSTCINELQGSALSASVLGGGQIRVNPTEKTIKIWDSSGAYGYEPDRNKTVKLLEKAFPEYKVTASR